MRHLILALLLLPAPAAHAWPAANDTIDIYGGPGSLEGMFQTAAGEPDSQGWIGVDETIPEIEDRWRISTFGAAVLDTTVADNHAWWCGRDFPSCGEFDPAGGYGNSWNAVLGTSLAVDPTREATVTLLGVMNVDTEPGYDFVNVESALASGPRVWGRWDGHEPGVALSCTDLWRPGDYGGAGGDEVRVQIRFESDDGWSDEDCQWPTGGAVQVDNLRLVVEQPGLPTLYGPVETCEPGDEVHWRLQPVPGAGNFAQLWTGLDDLDPDRDNPSPQWAFIDDGLVVPGVGPTHCWTRCYGPDSLVVNHDARNPPFENSILSPPIALPAGWEGTLRLSFDAYIDPAECFAVGVRWGMLATDDPFGQGGWVETRDPRLLYRYGDYHRFEFAVPDEMVPPSSRWVRIKLTAKDWGVWCWGAMDSPAPYLDNVRLQLGPRAVSDVPSAVTGFEARAAPNPFNPATVVRWNLPRAGDLAVTVYDARGRRVRTLHRGFVEAGPGERTWRGRDDAGLPVGAGLYFCRVESAAGRRTLKLTLLK